MFKFIRKTLLYVVLAPFAVMGLGAACNQAVLVANNDTFPVRINPVKLYDWSNKGAKIKIIAPIPGVYPNGIAFVNDNMHIVMTPYTKLNWLADNFDFHTRILSVGDFLIMLGEYLNGFACWVWAGALLRKTYAE